MYTGFLSCFMFVRHAVGEDCWVVLEWENRSLLLVTRSQEVFGDYEKIDHKLGNQISNLHFFDLESHHGGSLSLLSVP